MKGVLLGLVVGAVIAGGAVKLWSNGQIDTMVQSYQDDETELNHLKGENATLRTTLNSMESNAYDRAALKVCVLHDGLRSSAMNAYLAELPMSDVERGAFQEFGPMVAGLATKTSQAKLIDLTSENAKLTDACLDHAKIIKPNV